MFQNDSAMNNVNNLKDEDRLLGVANYALSVCVNLEEELGERPDNPIPGRSIRRVSSAVKWIEERLASIPSHEGKPFEKGWGSAAELDALVRRALRTLRRIARALERAKKARAHQAAVAAEILLEDRLRKIDQNLRCRAWGIAA